MPSYLFKLFRPFFVPALWFDGDAGAGASGGGAAGGGAGDSGQGAGAGGGGQGAGGDSDPVVSFKQSELNKSYADRAKRAAESAVNDLLKSLGIKSADDLKAALKKAQDTDQAQLTELQKAQQAASAAQARIADLERSNLQVQTEAQTARVRSAVELAAARLGFHNPEDAYQLADVAGIEIGEDGKVNGAEEALKALIKARPYLVKSAAGGGGDINATRRNGEGATSLTDEQKHELAAIYGVKQEFIK